MGRLHTTTPRSRGVIPTQCRKSYVRIETVELLVASARQTMRRQGHTPAATERQDFERSGPADVVRCECCSLVCCVSYGHLRMLWGDVYPGDRTLHLRASCPTCVGTEGMVAQ